MTQDNDSQTPPTNNAAAQNSGERIAKILARAGVGSRRAVERMIAAGMVRRFGHLISDPATKITDVNGITVDGRPVQPPEPPRLWKYHKPRGQVTTYHDPEGRTTVFEGLPQDTPRVVAVGRLDINTEGLLLLTNDGGLARWLELPANGWRRTYRVRAHGSINRRALDEIRKGAIIEGVAYRPAEIEIEENDSSNVWLNVTLTEGKNREVRKLLEYAGLSVNRLIRTAYGPFTLGKQPRYKLLEIPSSQLKIDVAGYFNETDSDTPQHNDDSPRAKPVRKETWAKAKPKNNVRRAGKQKRRPATTDGNSKPQKAASTRAAAKPATRQAVVKKANTGNLSSRRRPKS
ncbi:MAG: pseudouridylate synthase [Kordiimonas sp.]|nr:pseudouridylate synthase [Kordiimonas sp.]